MTTPPPANANTGAESTGGGLNEKDLKMKNKNPRQRGQLEAMAEKLGMKLEKTNRTWKWRLAGDRIRNFNSLADVEKFLVEKGGEKEIKLGRPKKFGKRMAGMMLPDALIKKIKGESSKKGVSVAEIFRIGMEFYFKMEGK